MTTVSKDDLVQGCAPQTLPRAVTPSSVLFGIYWIGGYIGAGGAAAGYEAALPNESPDPFDHVGQLALRIFWLIFGAGLAAVCALVARPHERRGMLNLVIAVVSGVGFFACLLLLSDLLGVLAIPVASLTYVGLVWVFAHALTRAGS